MLLVLRIFSQFVDVFFPRIYGVRFLMLLLTFFRLTNVSPKLAIPQTHGHKFTYGSEQIFRRFYCHFFLQHAALTINEISVPAVMSVAGDGKIRNSLEY
jgi:hypothetical protein